jgi:hypothetical protein
MKVKNKTHFLIVGGKYGQMANRLFSFSHYIASAIEHNFGVINLYFDEYNRFFNSTSSNNFLGYPIFINIYKSKFLHKISQKLSLLLFHFLSIVLPCSPFHEILRIDKSNDKNGVDYNLDSDEFVSILHAKKLVFVKGWRFRAKLSFKKHQDIIRQLFQPLDIYKNNIDKLIQYCRNNVDILVGVHIRKGDYKEYSNGIYYYDLDIYAEKMLQLSNILSQQGTSVGFLLCSNENIELHYFNGLQIFLATNHPIEDLYELSHCDYIIGPPSTYSMWASFMGKVPLCIIDRKDKNITDLNSFRIING